MYDDAMKAMCAEVPGALCRWLGLPTMDPLGQDVGLLRLSEMAPKATTRQVDALLAVGDRLVLHLEFQTASESFFAWRMLDYRSLLVRRPEVQGKVLLQHVIALGAHPIRSGVHDNQVDYDFAVHYVRNEHVDRFLAEAALAPFAALADVPDRDRPAVLRRAMELIQTVPDDHLQRVLTQAAADLAKIRLDATTIKSTLEAIMPVPSVMPELYELYRQERLEQIRQEMITSLLRYRFGTDERIPAVAGRLATADPDTSIPLIEEAKSLDELAAES